MCPPDTQCRPPAPPHVSTGPRGSAARVVVRPSRHALPAAGDKPDRAPPAPSTSDGCGGHCHCCGSRTEATAQGAGVLVRCGVARGRCTYVTGRAGAREGSGRHRLERLPPEIRGVPLHVLCVRCCTVALLAAGTAAALTSTIPAASPPSLFCSYPFSLLHTRAGRRGMTFGRICT